MGSLDVWGDEDGDTNIEEFLNETDGTVDRCE